MENNNTILSIYETFSLQGKDVSRILVQGIDLPERRIKLINRINEANAAALDAGQYNYLQNLYAHPANAKKPYLDKYKIA